MSCFIMRTTSSASSVSRGSNGKVRSWRWWRMSAGRLASATRSKLRRSVGCSSSSAVLAGLGAARGRRHHHHRRAPAAHQYSRSFAPVYVDELYSSSQQQPRKSLSVVHEGEAKPQPGTSKLTRAAAAATAVTTTATTSGGNNKARRVRTSLMLSPMRGGICMGEVDLRAEVFIRKFREEMRLQSQRSAEEFQAMLARGL